MGQHAPCPRLAARPAVKPSAAQGRAHAKIILVGEHAVVYGFPAIVAPLETLGAVARVEPCAGPVVLRSRYGLGGLDWAPEPVTGLRQLTAATLRALGATPSNLALSVDATVPAGVGLGSSAAVAVAIVRALYRAHRRQLNMEGLVRLASIGERFAHGAPSGLDLWAASSSAPLWFVRGRPAVRLRLSRPLALVVANSGVPSETRRAVERVRHRLWTARRRTWADIERLGALAREMREALGTGGIDRVGNLFVEAHRLLDAVGVGHPATSRLTACALQAGALGAKTTGGGLGGSVVALARDVGHARRLREALLAAGAAAAWTTRVGGVSDGEDS